MGSTPTGGTRHLVVHCKREPYDVYVGRPRPWEGLIGDWGNPFSCHPRTPPAFRCSSVEEAIACYEEWLLSQPDLLARARAELRDKVLGCWCYPGPCHGDVLARLANTPREEADCERKEGDDTGDA